MKKILAVILTLFLSISLCSCSSKTDFSGEWVSVKNKELTLTFQKDDSCTYSGSIIVDENGGLTFTPEQRTYKYTFEKKVSVITVYSSISSNYTLTKDNGKDVITSANGEILFVRSENFEEYHNKYLEEEKQKQLDRLAEELFQKEKEAEAFYNEGKEGKTELEPGKEYVITDKLSMTAKEYVRSKEADKSGNYPIFIRASFKNLTDETVILRYGYYNDELFMNSDLSFNANIKKLGQIEIIYITNNISDIVLESIEDDYTGTGTFRDALVVEPNEEKEYFIKLPGSKSKTFSINENKNVLDAPEHHYITLKFDKIEFFLNSAELEKTVE